MRLPRLLASVALLTACAAWAQVDGGAPDPASEYAPLPSSAPPVPPPSTPAASTPPPAAPSHPESASPDEAWSGFPSPAASPDPTTVEPARARLPLPPPPPPVPPPPARPSVAAEVPLVPNDVSMFGAPALGQWRRGVGLFLGFPVVGARAAVGLTDSIDVGIGFDTFYGVMNEFRASAKWQFLSGAHFSGALALEGGRAFFVQKASAEGAGARWLTGRRNYNLAPGLIFSYRGASPRAARMFLDLRYLLAFDTEPFQRVPLGGVPAKVQLGHNVPVRAGAEMPFSPTTSFLFMFGFDVHGRQEDSPVMVSCSVGLVTSL